LSAQRQATTDTMSMDINNGGSPEASVKFTPKDADAKG
jgi:hypothetical protein